MYISQQIAVNKNLGIQSFCPKITLIINSEDNELIEYPDRQVLRLWSFNDRKERSGINFSALKLEFSNDTIIPGIIPIKNGYLFGDENLDQVLYNEE